MGFWDKLFGNKETELTEESKKKLHLDAQRFARLLVMDIKLHNEYEVSEGNKNADIYIRLKKEIDRSRKVYERRVPSVVAANVDYFHDELVKTLAGGDESKLGIK